MTLISRVFKISIIFGVLFNLLEVVRSDTDASSDAAENKKISNIQKLKEKLLTGYDATTRPVTHHSNTTVVQFSFEPAYIVNLNEDWLLFSLDGWLLLRWDDYRLAWNKTDYDGIEWIALKDHLIWQPDITVYNAHSGLIDPKVNTHLVLEYTGHVIFLPPVVLDTRCPLESKGLYPEDEITCNITFGSWTQHGWQLDLQSPADEKLTLDFFDNSNPRWELLLSKAKLVRNVNYYNCCEEPYIQIQASFPLRRRPPPELQIIYSPCVMVMALTLMMFWIHPHSNKKIFLGGFLFFVLCMLIIYVAYSTKSIIAVKRSVTFLEKTLYALTSAIILEIVIINLCQISEHSHPPNSIVQFFSSPMAKYILVWVPWEKNLPSDKTQIKQEEDNQPLKLHQASANEEWTLFAIGLDRFLFFIYTIVFLAIHHI